MPTVKELSDRYDKWKDDNAGIKLAADLTPGVGVGTALVDTAQDLYKGEYVDAGLSALGAIPALGGAKVLKAARKAKAAKATKPAEAALKKGGRVTGYRGYGKAKKV